MAGESYAIPPKDRAVEGNSLVYPSTISLPAAIACRPSACCAKRSAFRVRRCALVSRGSSRVERSRAVADRVRMCVLPSR